MMIQKKKKKTEDQQTVAVNGTTLKVFSDSTLKDYKSLGSLIIPLDVYFGILLMHVQATRNVASLGLGFLHYNAHLIQTTGEYQWSAVVGYHMAFVASRCLQLASSLSDTFPPHKSFPPIYLPPPCPNSHPCANLPPPDSSHLPCVETTLKEQAWSFYLRDYPDPTFVTTLIHIIRHGCNLGYQGDKYHSQGSSNLKSTLDHAEDISIDITAQVANGHT
jgi:hypothetical protein